MAARKKRRRRTKKNPPTMSLFTIGVAGGIGYLLWRAWQTQKAVAAQRQIARL